MPQASTQTTVADVLAHVRTQQAKAQIELDALHLRNRHTPLNAPESSWLNLEIEKTHGRVMGLAEICGYLEARVWIDEINSLPLPVSLS